MWLLGTTDIPRWVIAIIGALLICAAMALVELAKDRR